MNILREKEVISCLIILLPLQKIDPNLFYRAFKSYYWLMYDVKVQLLIKML